MSEQNKDQEILRQYLDSIKGEEERKKLQYLARLSRLNIGIAVFLSLLIPIGGYCYTRRWKAVLWLMCGGALIGMVIGGTARNNKEAMARAFGIGSVAGTIIAPIDNALAISRAKKQIEELSK
ncbi:hypothetical protein [Dolichospermum compactum]|uniref:Transmembrane protein n=1 Tax=Dolichospermum compactum NIES-806 TaxID=1973481 RepID=A0A1Z4V7K0_9CYAN|nr:hypothetical protein [Dolichospermum compactum]BAZ87408.1 hypothetical protein NIES806_36310 [Dolichospermum compactum NIES-806]